MCSSLPQLFFWGGGHTTHNKKSRIAVTTYRDFSDGDALSYPSVTLCSGFRDGRVTPENIAAGREPGDAAGGLGQARMREITHERAEFVHKFIQVWCKIVWPWRWNGTRIYVRFLDQNLVELSEKRVFFFSYPVFVKNCTGYNVLEPHFQKKNAIPACPSHIGAHLSRGAVLISGQGQRLGRLRHVRQRQHVDGRVPRVQGRALPHLESGRRDEARRGQLAAHPDHNPGEELLSRLRRLRRLQVGSRKLRPGCNWRVYSTTFDHYTTYVGATSSFPYSFTRREASSSARPRASSADPGSSRSWGRSSSSP